MGALSKAMMAENLCESIGLSRSNAKMMVEEFFAEVKLLLESGEHVKLSGFGNFILRDKSERPGRNPKTGEFVAVMPRRVVTFKPGLKLKTQIEKKDNF